MVEPWRLVDWLFLPEVEGTGFSNYVEDAGGPTKFGITAKSYGGWLKLGRDATAEEVETLTATVARRFYIEEYIAHKDLRLDLLDRLVIATTIFDTAVLFGRVRAAKWAQESTEAVARIDGNLGEVSHAALNAISPAKFVHRMQKFRIESHVARVKKDSTQMLFMLGWCRRTVHLTRLLQTDV